MDNLTTIALLVIFTSIVVFFSQEIGDFFKKIYRIPGVKLFAPFVLLTSFVVYLSPWFFLGAMTLKQLLNALNAKLTQWLPYPHADEAVKAFLLFSLSFLPVFLLNLWVKRRSYLPFSRPYLLNTMLWLIFVLLMMV